MFGYIVPCVPELKVRDLELYRQYYCGLCRSLKDRYHRTADLAYDAAFIHALGDALTVDTTTLRTVRCAAHPVRGIAARQTPSADYAADVNILMAYAKASDDARDGGTLKDRARLPVLRRKSRTANENVPDLSQAMAACDEQICALEKDGCAEPDAAADPYGVLFGKTLMDLDVVQSHVLYDMGYNIGRWVYLIDAWDDRKKDAENGQYNVYNEKQRAVGISDEQLMRGASFSLHYTLAQAADALSRLSLKKNSGLLDNIVRLGLYQQTNSVLTGQGRIQPPAGHREAQERNT